MKLIRIKRLQNTDALFAGSYPQNLWINPDR